MTSRQSSIELVRTTHPTLKHPLTGAPLVSEFTVRGRPVWTAMGGDKTATGEGGQNGGQGAAGEGQNGGQTGGQNGGQAAGGNGAQGSNSGQLSGQNGGQQNDHPWSDPAKAQAEIERLRAENAKDRTAARENAATEERNRVLKALGLNPDGTQELTVEQLSGQLADKDKLLATQAREIAAGKAIRTHGGDADALGDSRTFATALDQLDPAAADFTSKVDALVKQTITDNPKFKLQAQAAGQSGGEFSGGSGEQQKNRPTSLGAAIADHYRQ